MLRGLSSVSRRSAFEPRRLVAQRDGADDHTGNITHGLIIAYEEHAGEILVLWRSPGKPAACAPLRSTELRLASQHLTTTCPL